MQPTHPGFAFRRKRTSRSTKAYLVLLRGEIARFTLHARFQDEDSSLWL